MAATLVSRSGLLINGKFTDGKGLKVQGYTLFEITTNPAKLDHAKQYIYDGLKSGALVPVLDRVFSLDQIVEAHQYMESNQQNGKIIVTVP